jgi:UPF0271 protein
VIVLDTSAFIMGYNPSKPGEAFSVAAVEDELSHGTMPHLRFQMFKDRGELTIREPTSRARRVVQESVSQLGESGYVSDADREVLALALDLKSEEKAPIIVSDDYAIQNLAEHLQLNYRSLANYGILHKFEWIMYCPACHRKYKPPAKKCAFCGSALKRKVLSKKRTAKTT